MGWLFDSNYGNESTSRPEKEKEATKECARFELEIRKAFRPMNPRIHNFSPGADGSLLFYDTDIIYAPHFVCFRVSLKYDIGVEYLSTKRQSTGCNQADERTTMYSGMRGKLIMSDSLNVVCYRQALAQHFPSSCNL
jgi:hypothetical protein